MKKTVTKLAAFLFLSVIISFTSCSNDDGIEEKELSSVTEEFQEKVSQMDLPSSMKSSDDTYAQQASGYFNSVKVLGQSFSALLTVPANATSSKTAKAGKGTNTGDTKTYTWTSEEDGVEITYTITEESDRYTFTYSVTRDGVLEKVMSGYQLLDGSYAEFSLHAEGVVVATFKFWVNGDDVKAELTAGDLRIELETNLDTSEGIIKVYENGELTAEYIWNADGTGSCTDHETGETYTW